MGADDGDNKPHPAAKNPQAPCNGDGPGLPHWFQDIPVGDQPHVVRVPRPLQQQQVTEPEGYAVAGKVLLAAAGALAGVLLALVALYLYNTSRRRRLASAAGGGLGQRRLGRSPAIAGGHDRDDGATPRGLDPAVLRALPVVVVGQGGGGGGAAGDCAVCLGELQPGEKVRALPRCGHVFHAECIDAWFRGNATCPLCRADVVLAPGADDAEVSAPPLPELRINVGVDGAADAKAASTTTAAMGRLPSGTDLDKTRRAFFASTRSTSF